MKKSKLIKEYLKPVRIVECSENICNAEALLANDGEQILLNEKNYLTCEGGGYILLDFGKEIHGGIRILAYFSNRKRGVPVRLRFGESVGEASAELGEKNACNDHSVRDFRIILPNLSDQEWGRTGFRFVRGDFSDARAIYRLVNVYAFSTRRDLRFIGGFQCDDERINTIYDIARYTVYVNMQENLWEGIKRDRLIWMGDMQPEVLSITDIFGADECVENALRMSIESTPLPAWFGNIPTYSFWMIQILFDYYMKVKNTKFVRRYLPYAEGVLHQLDDCVNERGIIDYTRCPANAKKGFFLDWPTNRSKDRKAGNRYLYIFVLENMKKLYASLGMPESPLCNQLLEKLKRKKERDVFSKQVVALGYLAGQIGREEAAQKLKQGGAKGMSVFMSYFILRAVAESDGIDSALDLMKEYYGAMCDRGATAFWEDFDVEWLKGSGRIDEKTPDGLKDLHGDYGKYCYKGFRRSLCHGWACGPVQFLTEKVLGIEVLDAGCKIIAVKPDLGKLHSACGKFPTPYGAVSVHVRREGNSLKTDIFAPPEVVVIR